MKVEDLDFHVLTCLVSAKDGRHGYAVRQLLSDRLGVRVPLQSIYRVFDRLQKQKKVERRQGTFEESYAGIPRKTYTLTDGGRSYLGELALIAQSRIKHLSRSLTEYEKVVSHDESGKAIGG